MAVRTIETAKPMATSNDDGLITLDELRSRLRAVGEERYHHKHPFHLMMHEGRLSRGQLQAWALNRYYYQSIIPIKDSIILSRGPDPAFRRAWRKRVIDHDGDVHSEGGIKRWLKLAEATGLDPDEVRAGKGTLPATRFAVNEYLNIVRNRSLLEAVASSLTELFSRDLISLRTSVTSSSVFLRLRSTSSSTAFWARSCCTSPALTRSRTNSSARLRVISLKVTPTSR